MRLTVVGCAGSFPGPEGPASCYLLTAEHAGRSWAVVMDLGNGALGPLQRHADPMSLDAVLLSHLHPDHCLDLTGLHVMRTHHPGGPAPTRLPVHAPAGAGARLARAQGVTAPSSVEETYDFRELRCRQDFVVGPFRVTPFRVEHPVEAYGFRVECRGATLAFTGDTDACPELTPLMADADLVLADAAFVEGRDEARGVHLTGRRAARAAVDAGGVQRLMLTHVPSWNDPEVCRAQAGEVWPGEVELARPGMVLDLG
jgi:ribonuclease BN (tRNA processing enzyme)